MKFTANFFKELPTLYFFHGFFFKQVACYLTVLHVLILPVQSTIIMLCILCKIIAQWLDKLFDNLTGTCDNLMKY